METSELQPWLMTRDEFYTAIDNAVPKVKTISTQIDWGKRNRGQGKRMNGTVVGSMSDGPYGIQTYYGYVPDYKEWIENKENIPRTSINPFIYSQAREIGLSHVEAGRYSLLEDKYHKKQVLQALSEGKPVPEKVLKDYPELKTSVI